MIYAHIPVIIDYYNGLTKVHPSYIPVHYYCTTCIKDWTPWQHMQNHTHTHTLCTTDHYYYNTQKYYFVAMVTVMRYTLVSIISIYIVSIQTSAFSSSIKEETSRLSLPFPLTCSCWSPWEERRKRRRKRVRGGRGGGGERNGG